MTIEPDVIALFIKCAELCVCPHGIDWTHKVVAQWRVAVQSTPLVTEPLTLSPLLLGGV